ncbi:helix-turn-helix domain-containing protein [Terrimonas rubra]|uniref:Helix-turn-helix domain-containing protein n=1 Tax=Terrimonas rubra TaxID=1035890 RepID=A0ABW6A308_9BACT
MSRTAGMNTSTFKKMFKQINGQSIYDYLSTHRMDEVRNRLLHINESIKRIALDLGFSALSNFSKAFKKQFLVPHSFYRRKG